MLRTSIPNLLKSQYYTEKRDAIVEGQQKKQRDLLQKFEEEVAEEGFSVIQVQMGLFARPDLIPVIEGQAIPFAKIEALVKEKKIPKETLDKLKAKYEELTTELEALFEKLKEIDEETRTAAPEVGRGGHRADHQGRHRRDPEPLPRARDRRLPGRGRAEPRPDARPLQEPEEGREGAGAGPGGRFPRLPRQPPRRQLRPEGRAGRHRDQPDLPEPLRLDRIHLQPDGDRARPISP